MTYLSDGMTGQIRIVDISQKTVKTGKFCANYLFFGDLTSHSGCRHCCTISYSCFFPIHMVPEVTILRRRSKKAYVLGASTFCRQIRLETTIHQQICAMPLFYDFFAGISYSSEKSLEKDGRFRYKTALMW